MRTLGTSKSYLEFDPILFQVNVNWLIYLKFKPLLYGSCNRVLIAAIYYLVILRNTEKTRRYETSSNRLQQRSLEFYLTYHEVMTMVDWETYDE